MAFDIDVLIVYADRDNEPLLAGEPGWVTQFRKFLELMLTQVVVLIQERFHTIILQ